MNTLYSFAIHVASMAVVCILIEGLVPRGVLQPTVKLCIGILFILSIAVPMVELIGGAESYDWEGLTGFQAQSAATIAETYENLLKGYYKAYLEGNEKEGGAYGKTQGQE